MENLFETLGECLRPEPALCDYDKGKVCIIEDIDKLHYLIRGKHITANCFDFLWDKGQMELASIRENYQRIVSSLTPNRP